VRQCEGASCERVAVRMCVHAKVRQCEYSVSSKVRRCECVPGRSCASAKVQRCVGASVIYKISAKVRQCDSISATVRQYDGATVRQIHQLHRHVCDDARCRASIHLFITILDSQLFSIVFSSKRYDCRERLCGDYVKDCSLHLALDRCANVPSQRDGVEWKAISNPVSY